MKKEFVVFSLNVESSFLGLYAEARFDTESEALAFLEELDKREKGAYYQPYKYVILPEYTV